MTRVLIADDESSIRFVLHEALTEAGHEVVDAADGNQAASCSTSACRVRPGSSCSRRSPGAAPTARWW